MPQKLTEVVENGVCFQNTTGFIWICLLNIYIINTEQMVKKSNLVTLILVALTYQRSEHNFLLIFNALKSFLHI